MTLDAIETLHQLNNQAAELDRLAEQLERVEGALLPVTAEYDEFMAAFEVGLWEQAMSAGSKAPPEKLREQMGRRAMRPELLGEYVSLTSRRRQLEKRIASCKASLDARRSILSAMKDGIVS